MFDLASILSQFSIPNPGINILDVIIIFVVLFYAHEGFTLGFTLAFLDLTSFVLSFIVALKFYGFIAYFLANTFSLPVGFANAGGFFITALICEVTLSILFRRLLKKAPHIPINNKIAMFFRDMDHWFGLLPGMISAFIVLSFILSVVVSLPSSPLIKSLVTDSKMSTKLIANTSFFEKQLNQIFGGALSETLNFLTVQPQSTDLVKLNFKVEKGERDSKAEQEMFRMVNTERAKAGVALLAFDDDLRDVARLHSNDMLKRGFFSHYTPEGLSPFDRMEKFGIEFNFAGENLALAPSTDLAMQGLMASPGHRKNILSPNFRKIGIGVIDGGVYGKMYSQEFSD